MRAGGRKQERRSCSTINRDYYVENERRVSFDDAEARWTVVVGLRRRRTPGGREENGDEGCRYVGVYNRRGSHVFSINNDNNRNDSGDDRRYSHEN